MMTKQRQYLTSDEAADYFGISSATLRNWRARGDGPPYIKVNPRVIRYQLLELEAWMDTKPRLLASRHAD
jgi:predicted DNA-binding transcriptional regulator AlpA